MREEVVLITGANGEIGHGLIRQISAMNCPIVAIDVNPLDKPLRYIAVFYCGRYPTKSCWVGWSSSIRIWTIYHLLYSLYQSRIQT